MNFTITTPSTTPTPKAAGKLKINARLVSPGEIICEAEGFLRGHGTFLDGNNILASIAGVVETVNKFVMVRALKSRYQGEVGDVVVGRVVGLTHKRWQIESNAKQDAFLLLSAIDLPGEVRRRRTEADSFNMRSLFVERDLISAEVQSNFVDGGMQLHIRTKYGKLGDGVLVRVSPSLIRRSTTHFHELDCGCNMIIGNNGFIWIYPQSEEMDEDAKEKKSAPTEIYVSSEVRIIMARLRNSIITLSTCKKAIYPLTIMEVYNKSLEKHIHPKEMLLPETMASLI
jgi:exosome complex component RRP4